MKDNSLMDLLKRHESPEFLAALETFGELKKAGHADSPELFDAAIHMLSRASPRLRDLLIARAVEFGLLPKSDGVAEDGTRLYSIDLLARHFGIDRDTVLGVIRRNSIPVVSSNDSTISRTH